MNELPPVTWSQLAYVILFALGVIVLIYLVLFLRSLNQVLKIFKNVLKENKPNIDKALKDVPIISGNIAEVSDSAKNELKVIEKVITNIGDTSELAVETVKTLKNDVVGRAKSIVDIIEFIRKIFVKDDEKKNENDGTIETE